ncbi:ATP-binding protein (plasmid) [Rhodococcus pseudokoreensis]|uniref:ATP-binding protein n=1 Tax=Rhodococcus pseudokoreensis TaxID=2811421 RepID=A0A974VXI1_9NOCA|nr:ATP-binding protein [Rhodococcus pseudokoreensis]QSE87166.1 ATP-binding protein [Rhodococcus pseudokoreensis]
MLQQNLFVHENLRWTRSGVVWADFILSGIEYGYRPDSDKELARAMHKMLLRALSGEALLMGVCASLNPYAVVERMTRGVDLDAHPDWEAECEASIPTLEAYNPGRRIFWLSVPLATSGWKERANAAWSSAVTSITDQVGLSRQSPSAQEIALRKNQAQLIANDIPAYFSPTPVTPAQISWLHQHSLQRGVALDADLPRGIPTEGEVKTSSSFTAFRLDEGAQTDRVSTGVRSKLPTLQRVLKLDQPWELEPPPPSYQCVLALADLPAGGVLFPGSEYYTLADAIPGADIDWAIRFRIRSSEEVRKKNQRALVNLNEQYNQREGELSHGHSVLDSAADDLAEYAAKMEADSMEVEVESTTLFVVGADSVDGALALARSLAKLFEGSNYKLVAPLGFQEDLWHAANPGTPAPKIVGEFNQITTATDFSAYVPCTHSELGDSAGALLALNITSARIGVVHHDLASKSEADVSGSFGASGNLGSGKSILLKVITGSFVDRGGKTVIVDHTEAGEYEVFARTITDATIASLSDPQWSIDPLRIFDAYKGAEVAATVLMPLLQIQPDDDFGVTLAMALDPEYRREHGLLDGGLPELIAHLDNTDCHLKMHHELARKIGVYAKKSYAAAMFRNLPPLDRGAPAIVFRTESVKLPSQNELQHDHLFRQMSLEKRFGRAAYTLIGLIAREICFADPAEPALFLLDECHRLTRQEEGLDIAIEFLKEGRKESAYIGLASQDALEGMGNETLRGLIPTRFGMRQTDRNLARNELAFLDLDPADPDLLKELTEQTSPVVGKDPETGKEYVEPHRRGEGYMRDAYGNIGRIKVLLPSDPHRAAAVLTTPASKEKVHS